MKWITLLLDLIQYFNIVTLSSWTLQAVPWGKMGPDRLVLKANVKITFDADDYQRPFYQVASNSFE